MSSIQIHEFSTGIIPERTADGGWISCGFTGQYMNVTLNSIPYEVERSIANKEFAVSEGAFRDRPPMIGREIVSDGGMLSVVAVVTKGKDEKGRSASLYRYFLTDAPKGLEKILAWIRSEERAGRGVVFNPFDRKDINHPNESYAEAQFPFLPALRSLSTPTPCIIESRQDCTPESINQLARTKAQENGEAVSWAFNVEALEQPRRFQVVYAASNIAMRRIQQAISSTPIASISSAIDEQAIKSAIKSLINSSQVKPDAVQALEASLGSLAALEPNEQEGFWQDIFDGQGAVNAQKQQIYSPQMIRLLTLRAMILPQTISDYLKWLQPDSGKKSSEACDIALAFQSQLSGSIQPSSQLGSNLRNGVNHVLEQVFHERVSVESANWLLNPSNRGLWAFVMPQMMEALRQFLASVRSNHSTEGAGFQYESRTWQQIRSRLKMSVPAASKGDPKYLAIAELFTNLGEPAIAVCFYQAARGLVPLGVYTDAKRTGAVKSRTAFGIPLRREKSVVEHFRSVLEHPITIGVMFALIVVIVGATVFKLIESRQEAEKEQYAKRSQQKPDTQPPITDLIPGTSLPAGKLPSSEQFKETRKVLQRLVEELSADPKVNTNASSLDKDQIKQRVIEALESSLLGGAVSDYEKTALNYQNIIENVPPPDYLQAEIEKQRWIALIYSYQLRNPSLTPDGFIKTGLPTYKKLKQDIRDRLVGTPLQNPETVSPSEQAPTAQPRPSLPPPEILRNPPQNRVNDKELNQ